MTASCIGFLFYYSCATPTPPPADTFCLIATPIYWSARDTRKTREQADRHNRIWKSLCGASSPEIIQND